MRRLWYQGILQPGDRRLVARSKGLLVRRSKTALSKGSEPFWSSYPAAIWLRRYLSSMSREWCIEEPRRSGTWQAISSHGPSPSSVFASIRVLRLR